VPRRAAALTALLLACVSAAASAQAPSDPASPDPFTRRAWNLEILGQALSEAWNYNGNHENLFGLSTGVTYGIREGLALVAATPMFLVTERTSNATLIGVTGGVRKRVARWTRASAFVEIVVGVSRAEASVPPRGTQFNYVFQPGGGMTWRLGRSHGIAGVRWLHLSNNSLEGRNRNPDIEAIGVMAGVLLPF
jgi:hypothetical protein